MHIPGDDVQRLLMLLPNGQHAAAFRAMQRAHRAGWRDIDFHPLCWQFDGDLHRLDLAGVSPRDGLLWFLPSDDEIDENPPYEP